MREPRIVVWDLETFGFDFSADKGFILCVSYKYIGEDRIYTIVNNKRWDDKDLCRKISAVLSDADGWVTQNGKRFDVKFLNTRLLKNNLPPLPGTTRHFDTQEVMWKKLKMRTRLESAQKFFGFPEAKTPVSLETWVNAAGGSKESMSEVIHHCEQDIKVTEMLYKKLIPLGGYAWSVASMSEKPAACPHCAGEEIQRRGWNYALKQKSPRFQCLGCGGWSRGKPEKI